MPILIGSKYSIAKLINIYKVSNSVKPLVMQGISAVEELSLWSSVHKKEIAKVAAW